MQYHATDFLDSMHAACFRLRAYRVSCSSYCGNATLITVLQKWRPDYGCCRVAAIAAALVATAELCWSCNGCGWDGCG